jgi:CheY-like chemotaxis protein
MSFSPRFPDDPRIPRLPGLPDEGADLVRATLAAARRGGVLLQRIGAISGARELRPEPVALAPLLDDLQMMAGASLPAGLRLEIAQAPELGDVILDPGALQDSLLNLILNARDAMADRAGTIRLTVQRTGDTWLDFVLQDQGPGFSDEALKRGTDPFYTTKGGEGSGLGLAMVFDHASLAGRSLRLDNPPGGGARVVLRLPYRPAEARPPGMMILLVEDSPEIRTHVREMLCAQGHSVIEAGTVAEAEALAALDGLGLVLSDIQLPGAETGLALAGRLRQARPGVALGLMTSLPLDDPLHRAARDSFPVLAKPVGPAALDGFVRRCLQGGTLPPLRAAG